VPGSLTVVLVWIWPTLTRAQCPPIEVDARPLPMFSRALARGGRCGGSGRATVSPPSFAQQLVKRHRAGRRCRQRWGAVHLAR
jgi:hypothetical protein